MKLAFVAILLGISTILSSEVKVGRVEKTSTVNPDNVVSNKPQEDADKEDFSYIFREKFSGISSVRVAVSNIDKTGKNKLQAILSKLKRNVKNKADLSVEVVGVCTYILRAQLNVMQNCLENPKYVKSIPQKPVEGQLCISSEVPERVDLLIIQDTTSSKPETTYNIEYTLPVTIHYNIKDKKDVQSALKSLMPPQDIVDAGFSRKIINVTDNSEVQLEKEAAATQYVKIAAPPKSQFSASVQSIIIPKEQKAYYFKISRFTLQ